MLDTIHHGKRNHPPRILVYGSEGVGKSTFAAGAPAPVFIATEDGIGQVETSSFPLCRTIQEVSNCLGALIAEEHAYRTVVIDSLDWLERIIHDDICRQHGVKSIEKIDYGKGYAFATTLWRQVIEQLNTLRLSKKMIVILIAHAKIETHSDPESATFDRFSPKLHKTANAMLCEWCDMILLATRKRGAAMGERGGQRILRCVGSPTCVAKSRFPLPEELPLEWTALMRAMRAASGMNASESTESNSTAVENTTTDKE